MKDEWRKEKKILRILLYKQTNYYELFMESNRSEQIVRTKERWGDYPIKVYLTKVQKTKKEHELVQMTTCRDYLKK